MSLTSHLKDPESEVRDFIRESVPLLSTAGTRGNVGKSAAKALNFQILTDAPIRITLPESEFRLFTSQLIGSAIDFRARMKINSKINPSDTNRIRLLYAFFSEQSKSSQSRPLDTFIAEMAKFTFYRMPNYSIISERGRDRISIVLAMLDRIWRSGTLIYTDTGFKLFCESFDFSWETFWAEESEYSNSVRELLATSAPILNVWSNAISTGTRFQNNPIFDGGRYIGGADGDWMIGDTLVESKAILKMDRPKVRDTLLQLWGYTLLDLDDSYGIRELGIWHARAGVYKEWDLSEILGCEPGSQVVENIMSLRVELRELLVGIGSDNQ